MLLVVPGSSTSSPTTPTPTSSSSSSQDSVFDVSRYIENPVSERSGSTSEERRGNPLHRSTETENKNKNGKSEEVLQKHGEPLRQRIETLPVLFMNYRWSREQKGNRSRASSVYTHFPKDPNCDICLKTKITRDYCRKRTGTVVPRADNFGDLITADYKVLSAGCESRNNHRHAGYSHTHVKQKLLRKHRRACKSSWSRRGSQKSSALTIPWNLANSVKNYPGIIVSQRHTDRKQMGLLKAQCAE